MALRTDERLATCLPVRAQFPAGAAEVVLLDLSMTGCRIETDSEHARVGATVLLAVTEQQDAAGQIAWKRYGQCGVSFYRNLPARIIDQVGATAA